MAFSNQAKYAIGGASLLGALVLAAAFKFSQDETPPAPAAAGPMSQQQCLDEFTASTRNIKTASGQDVFALAQNPELKAEAKKLNACIVASFR